MTGSEKFNLEIQKILREQVSTNWFKINSFNITIQCTDRLTTNISKHAECISVSLGNAKYPNDPVIRFKIPPSRQNDLIYFDIQYLNGISLTFYSSMNKNSYDIWPDSLDMFLKAWAQVLIDIKF